MTDIEAVRAKIGTVVDPELGVTIEELGMLGAVEERDGELSVELKLTTAACPLQKELRGSVRRIVDSLGLGVKVQFVTNVMNATEKRWAMDVARKSAKERARRPHSISPRTRIIAIASGKGGVGKSTITSLLALALAEAGFRVGVLDADIWGFSISKLLGFEEAVEATGTKESWSIRPATRSYGSGSLSVMSMGMLASSREAVMWRGMILNRAFQHFVEDVRWGDLDYLLVDMPPGTGDIQMGLSRLLPDAKLLLVTTPNENASNVAVRMLDMARREMLEVLGYVLNMAYFECSHGEVYKIFGEFKDEFPEELDLLGEVPIVANSTLNQYPLAVRGVTGRDVAAIVELARRLSTEMIPPIVDLSCTAKLEEIEAQLYFQDDFLN
ncbi:MAG: P-loop NTPase [Actinomycetota bacterium]|nr:P-loop NTPase [Actinomycetota bacterium]